MPNIIHYIVEYGNKSFSQMPFNEVDSLILSQLAYIRFEGAQALLPASIRTLYMEKVCEHSEMDGYLLEEAAQSKRFQDILLTEYTNRYQEESQFSAVTYLLPDEKAYIAYRGTDNTLVGWKEDFNLSFMTPVPAQTQACDYLNRVGGMLSCPLLVGGHSKGGNLAVYACAYADEAIQRRIETIYNNDGPGHDKKTIESAGYLRIAERIQTYIPKSSIVGMLLEYRPDYVVVDSEAHGLLQHYPYRWLVEANHFQTLPEGSKAAGCMSDSIREWLTGMSVEKRKYVIDTIYDVISASEKRTLKELKSNVLNFLPILSAAVDLDGKDKAELIKLLSQFFKIAIDQYSNLARESADYFKTSFMSDVRGKIRSAIEDRLTEGGKK